MGRYFSVDSELRFSSESTSCATMLSALQKLSRRVVLSPTQHGGVACTICCEFNASAWPTGNPMKVKTPLVPYGIQQNHGNETTVSNMLWNCKLTFWHYFPCSFYHLFDMNNTMYQFCFCLKLDQPRRNAGHSKWANIRHVKQANDMARSREITKFLNLIKVAVKGTRIPNLRCGNIIYQR